MTRQMSENNEIDAIKRFTAGYELKKAVQHLVEAEKMLKSSNWSRWNDLAAMTNKIVAMQLDVTRSARQLEQLVEKQLRRTSHVQAQ